MTQIEDCISVISVSFLAPGDSGASNVPDAWRLARLGDEGDVGLGMCNQRGLELQPCLKTWETIWRIMEGHVRKTSISSYLLSDLSVGFPQKWCLIIPRFPSINGLHGFTTIK